MWGLLRDRAARCDHGVSITSLTPVGRLTSRARRRARRATARAAPAVAAPSRSSSPSARRAAAGPACVPSTRRLLDGVAVHWLISTRVGTWRGCRPRETKCCACPGPRARRSSGGGTSWCLFATGNSLWRFDPVKRILKRVNRRFFASTTTNGSFLPAFYQQAKLVWFLATRESDQSQTESSGTRLIN